MQFSSIFRQYPSRSIYHRLTLVRCMGGGPRTFPGGLNKWQWKRMHEKKAREKEKRLLDQEKQVYQARVRSQIRANLESTENPCSGPEKPGNHPPNYGPLSPADQVRALADRFMKEGAEDLWNEADGPLEIPATKPGMICKPIDLQKLISEKCNSFSSREIDRSVVSNPSGSLTKSRRFSSFTGWVGDSRNGNLRTMSSAFDLVGSCSPAMLMDLGHNLCSRHYSSVGAASTSKKLNFTRNGPSPVAGDGENSRIHSSKGTVTKWPRFRRAAINSSDDDSEDYDEEEDEELESKGRDARKVVSSSAALGKYDMKQKKRIPLKFVEDEDDLSQQVEAIRMEVNRRRIVQEEKRKQAEEESIISSKRFDECSLSSFTVQALTEAGYVQMTSVQEATLSACLDGNDVLVKARAGTGKSIAYLSAAKIKQLPAIETVLKASNAVKVPRVPPIYVLILCPTRELASQICAEANVLLKHHDGIGVQTLVGGTRFKVDQRHLESDPCQIIVATPGRLLDHIENKSGISVHLMGLQMLVLDEADHLLNLGFRKDMEKIVDCLPRKRQSLLFSSTMPKEVRRISQLVLKREHVYIDTSGIGSLETHSKVKQFYLVTPHDQHLQIVHHLLKNHTSQVPEYKIIVFCATAMMVSLMLSFLREMKLNVRELHTKNSPLYRTRISDEFKESKELILLTSDISARGMNYPDVTLVIQVGIPSDRGQYINKLGRTGRQGKEGEVILLLAPWEQYFLDEIKDLPIEKCPVPDLDPDVKVKIEECMRKIDNNVKEAAYHAWLGYYNSIGPIGRDKTSLVEFANQFSASIGLQKPPALYRKTAIKMGLKGVPGITMRR